MIILTQSIIETEIFTWTSPTNGKTFEFDITSLWKFCIETEVKSQLVDVDEEGYKIVKSCRQIDTWRMARLTRSVVTSLPTIILFGVESDDSGLLVDGTHRFIWAYEHGIKTIPAWLLQSEQWKSYMEELHERDNHT